MQLTSLVIGSFRNIRQAVLEPGSQFNLVYGMNGHGKTNLLEAIYLLGNVRSFRSSRVQELIRHGEAIAQIRGEIAAGGTRSLIRTTLEPGGRKTDVDGKHIHRSSELHGRLNAVVFAPDDTGMIKLGPDMRRRYLDRAVYQSDARYLSCWHDYHRILKHRNLLLKRGESEGLDIWTERLAETGAEVIECRLRFAGRLEPKLKQHYATISGEREAAGIRYQPEGVGAVGSRQEIRQELLQLYGRTLRNDQRLGTTTAGPHRDDLQLFLNERPVKSFGSQGQQKSFVLALKMAEMDHLEEIFGEPPLLLLDDMSSELDATRNGNLLTFLYQRAVQVFMTTTERSAALLGSAVHCAVFRMEDGNLTYEGSDRT